MDFKNLVINDKRVYSSSRDFEDGICNDEIYKYYYSKMKELAESRDLDTETIHSLADGLMCELLKELGFVNMVKEFNDLEKWYS